MSVRAGREFLAIPGPTNVPDEVLRAMHRPAVDIYAGPLLAMLVVRPYGLFGSPRIERV